MTFMHALKGHIYMERLSSIFHAFMNINLDIDVISNSDGLHFCAWGEKNPFYVQLDMNNQYFNKSSNVIETHHKVDATVLWSLVNSAQEGNIMFFNDGEGLVVTVENTEIVPTFVKDVRGDSIKIPGYEAKTKGSMQAGIFTHFIQMSHLFRGQNVVFNLEENNIGLQCGPTPIGGSYLKVPALVRGDDCDSFEVEINNLIPFSAPGDKISTSMRFGVSDSAFISQFASFDNQLCFTGVFPKIDADNSMDEFIKLTEINIENNALEGSLKRMRLI